MRRPLDGWWIEHAVYAIWEHVHRLVGRAFDRLGIPRSAHPETVASIFFAFYLVGIAALILADAPWETYVVYAVAGFFVSLVLA